MENLNLADLKLSQEESRDIIEFSARKRNIKNYKRKSSDELLQSIKENKNNKQQSKNKERIDTIRKELKDLSYKLSRSELREIKKNLLYKKRNKKEINSNKKKLINTWMN